MSVYMNELKTSLGELVSKKTENCKEGNVPSNTEVFKNYIKLCTDDIINTTLAKKQEVFGRIKEEIDSQTVNPFTEIEAVEAEIQNVNAEIVRYSQAWQTYSEISASDDYEMFCKYYENGKTKNQIKTGLPCYENVLETAKRESENIKSQVFKGFLKCMLIALAGTALDSILLYPPFQTSNIGDAVMSTLYCIISALILDSLPTVLGFLHSKTESTEKMIELKGRTSKADMKKQQSQKFWSCIILAFTILVFAIYVVIRAVMLIGGGDFNRGIQTFLSGAFVEQLKETEFLLSDAFSIITPIASSIVCFIVSKMSSVDKFGFTDSFNAKIKRELNHSKEKCLVQKAILTEKKDKLLKDKNNKIQSIWRFYKTGRPPHNIELFSADVTAAAQMTAVNTFNGKYENFCQEARSFAELQINALKEELSAYCGKPCDILNMPLSKDEQAKLDDIWNTNGRQTENTINHINFIEQYISDLSEKWRNEEYDFDEYAV